MKTKTRKTIVFVRGDMIERGRPDRRGRPSYRWFDGWLRIVDGKETYPPVTYREAQAEAKAAGARAVFQR